MPGPDFRRKVTSPAGGSPLSDQARKQGCKPGLQARARSAELATTRNLRRSGRAMPGLAGSYPFGGQCPVQRCPAIC